MATDEQVLVEHLVPVDLTGVRDPGIQAVIQLAVSLGWNVRIKANNPALLIARDGYQKRVPTNTSVRMSVFQTALSGVMVHTEPHIEPTIELVEAIIAVTKPSSDHARRLRLAVGESPRQHRERLAAAEAETKGAREPQPLTQRLEIPDMTEPDVEEVVMTPMMETTFVPPADKADHGALMKVGPFMARKGTSESGDASFYVSDINNQREWEDGYVDYSCMQCGKAYGTPKGVGAHSQIHPMDRRDPAWKRRPVDHRERVEPSLEWADPPIDPSEWSIEVPEVSEEFGTVVPTAGDFAAIIRQIAELVAPELIAERDELRAKVAILTARLEEVEGEFDAFIELAASRRKRAEGD